jgi:hypothetical protein
MRLRVDQVKLCGLGDGLIFILMESSGDILCNIPRSNPIVNVNANVLKLVSCLISFLYAPFMA